MSLSLEPLYGALTAEITDLTAKLEKSRHEGEQSFAKLGCTTWDISVVQAPATAAAAAARS